MTRQRLHIDLETYSPCDLKRAGVYRYAEHPQTRVLCTAWAFDNLAVQVVPGLPPDHVRQALADPAVEKHAWNANFERTLLGPLDPEPWCCTMVQAAYWGLPMSLEQAGAALSLPVQKDVVGAKTMKRLMKPGKDGTDAHTRDPADLQTLMDYCRQDVEVERAISRAVPPLPASEQRLWVVDQRMSDRGVALDLALVERLRDVAEASERELVDEFVGLLGGLKPSQGAKVIEWLGQQGVTVLSLDKAAVAEALGRADLPPEARRALEIRQEFAKSSTKKLDAMLASVCSDGRVRGLTQFYGATRTGRWAGRLIQIQNLARPVIKDPKGAVQTVMGA